VIKNSQFDHNEDGFDTNSQNGDNPPPQNGTCPNNGISPITHTHSCWVFMDNYVHDNNNPNVPAAGSAAAGPVGTGMTVSGARDDTIMDNLFENNGAWGNLLVPYPDSGPPCTGGTPNFPLLGPGSCLYDEWGDAVIDNKYKNDGYFGNPTNGDFEALNFENGEPTDCFSGNTEVGGGSITPEDQTLEQKYPVCNGQDVNANTDPVFLQEVLCDSQVTIDGTDTCTPIDKYPRFTNIQNGLHAMPASKLPTMPNVCGGVPADAWCSNQKTKVKGCAAPTATVPVTVSDGERLVSYTARASAGTVTRRSKSVKLSMRGIRHRSVSLAVTEHIKVGSRKESFKFTRVYKRC
jgi:hypothetical protein